MFAKAIVFKNIKYNMREWLSGGAPPCQGGGRGFDPRLALLITGYPKGYPYFIYSKFKITKKELFIYERKRIIWFEIRIHSCVSRMCDRSWKCMKISIYMWYVWRSSIHSNVCYISCTAGTADSYM